MYFLPGCPNYEVGATAFDPRDCPRRQFKKGEFKFSLLGLASGTDINSLNTAYPAAGTAPSTNPNMVNVEKDFADYKTMIYRMTLDAGAMANSDGSLGAYVRHSTTNQTIPFANLAADKDLAGYSLVFDGPKFGEIR